MKLRFPRVTPPLAIAPNRARQQEIEAILFPPGFLDDLVGAGSVKVSKFTSVPRRLSGYDLFKRQQAHLVSTYQKQVWDHLLDQDKHHFHSNPAGDALFAQEVRVWKGYQIVSYLKNNAKSYDEIFNPYPYLGLYPWEILYDKFKNPQKVEAFEIDYYDCLARVKTLVVAQVHYKDIRQRWQRLNSDHFTTQLFADVYLLGQSGYAGFWKQQFGTYHLGNYQTRKQFTEQVVQRWKDLSETERSHYQNLPGVNPRSRLYKDTLVDRKVGRSLVFIYNILGADSLPLDFDWHQYRQSEVGNWIYQPGFYVDKYLYSIRLAKVSKLVTSVSEL